MKNFKTFFMEANRPFSHSRYEFLRMLKAIAGVRQKVRGAEIKRCKIERRKLERCGAKLKVRP